MIITIDSYTINIDVKYMISIMFSIFSAYFAYYQYKNALQDKKNQKILKKNFGSELFGKETIILSTYCYVKPNCTNIDPAREAEPKNLYMIEGNMFSELDKYLLKETPKKNGSRHILILADSGMGKTSFLLNYYAYNQKKPKRTRQRIALVPLGISDADEYIDKIENKESTVIFLDAFDEDTKAIKNHRERLAFLMRKKCSRFKRVIITCRTQFFPSDEEIPKETGILKVADRKAGEPGFYIFNKLYLSPLSDKQVSIFLKNRFKWNFKKRKKAKILVQKIPSLKVRPMLLAHIPDLINSNQTDLQYSYQLYEIMVDNWLEREKGWIRNKNDLRQFSEKLAFDLYINREKRGAEKISKNELSALAKEWNIQLEGWQLTGRSLLNGDTVGNYKFAHRSIMEFLFVVHFFKLNNKERPSIEWTDQQSIFALEFIKINMNKKINIEKANFRNCKNIPEWIEKGLKRNGEYSKIILAQNIEDLNILRHVDLSHTNLTGVKLTGLDLTNVNFRGCILRSADLSKSNLKNVDFREANLIEAILSGNLSNTNFRGADLSGVDFKGANLENATIDSFTKTKCIDFSGANLKSSFLLQANLNEDYFIDSNLTDAFLRYADLSDAKLIGAKLINACLKEASLYRADLTNADLTNADLIDAHLSESKLIGAKFIKSDLSGAILYGADLTNADLSGANLSGATLTEATLTKVNLNDTIFRYTFLQNTIFKNSINIPEWIEKGIDRDSKYSQKKLIDNIRNGFRNLKGVILISADLSGANLIGADLRCADLRLAHLNIANLINTDLRGADLSGAQLNGTNLEGADFSGAKIEGANFKYSENIPEWIKNGLNEKGFFIQEILIKNIKKKLKNLNKKNQNELNGIKTYIHYII